MRSVVVGPSLLVVVGLLAGAAVHSGSIRAAYGGGSAGALAKPPKSPTATPTSGVAPEGVIYFKGPSSDYFANADGSGTTALQIDNHGAPSRVLHDGIRWLVDGGADTDVQAYTDLLPNGFYRFRVVLTGHGPSGNDAGSVSLTVDDMEANGQNLFQWLDDPDTGDPDARIAWSARRWDLSASPPAVVEGGLYTAEVEYDPSTGALSGIDADSISLEVPFDLKPSSQGGSDCTADSTLELNHARFAGIEGFWPQNHELIQGGWFADVYQLAFRPSGAQVVYVPCSGAPKELTLSDVPGPPSDHVGLGELGIWPEWSHLDESVLVYQGELDALVGFMSIRTIDPNAAEPVSTVKTIVAGRPKGRSVALYRRPRWSPDGRFIAFARADQDLQTPDALLIVAAAGGSPTAFNPVGTTARLAGGWVAAPTD